MAAVAAALGIAVGVAMVGLDVLPGGADQTAVSASGGGPSAAASAGCPDGRAGTLQVAAPPELAPALRRAVEQAPDDGPAGCTQVEVAAMEPAAVTSALAAGWEGQDAPRPAVWIPRATVELDLARGDAGNVLPDEAPSLVRSPMVIAMPEPMADVLGWPDEDLDWEGVAQLVAADGPWASRGRADWDPFRLAMTGAPFDAEPAVGAITSLAGAVGALPGPDTAGQTDEERFEARSRLLLLERRISYLGGTVTDLLDDLRTADAGDALLERVSALPLTEQLVYGYNGGDGDDAPDTPLVAWYPEDGDADADFPWVVLDAPWVPDGTDAAADAVLDVLRSGDGLQRLRAAGFRDGSREATPELIDADGLRPDLAGEPGQARPALLVGAVAQAWDGLSQTGNLLGVIDVSGSMKAPVPGTGRSRLELSAEGLAAGVALMDPASHGGLWEFSTDLEGGNDWRELIPMGPMREELRGNITRQEAEVREIRQLRPREDTGLYDTILASYRHTQQEWQRDMLNVVIFFTDGKNDDPGGGLSLQELKRRLRESVDPQREVLFVGIGYGPEADFDVLEDVTEITGGRLYRLERPEDIRDAFVDVQTGNVR